MVGNIVTTLPAANRTATYSGSGDLATMIRVFDALDDQQYRPGNPHPGELQGSQLAWGTSYTLQSYMSMYHATGEQRYLGRLLEVAEIMFENRPAITDHTGKRSGGWAIGDRYGMREAVLKSPSGATVMTLRGKIYSLYVHQYSDLKVRLDMVSDTNQRMSATGSLNPGDPDYLPLHLAKTAFGGTDLIRAYDARSNRRAERITAGREMELTEIHRTYAVHAGMLCAPILEMAWRVRVQDRSRSQWGLYRRVDGVAKKALAAVDYSLWELRDLPGNSQAMGLWTTSDDVVSFPDVFLPHNMSSVYAHALFMAQRYTGNTKKYGTPASKLIRGMVNDINAMTNANGAAWPYWPTFSDAYKGRSNGDPRGWKPFIHPRTVTDDPSHAAICLAPLVTAYQMRSGNATHALLTNIARGFNRRMAISGTALRPRFDAGGRYAESGMRHMTRWARVAPFDHSGQLLKTMVQIMGRYPASPESAASMLGLADTIRATRFPRS